MHQRSSRPIMAQHPRYSAESALENMLSELFAHRASQNKPADAKPTAPQKQNKVRPSIRLEVRESNEAYTVLANIPGVEKEDINVSVDENQVSISFQVKDEVTEKEGERVIHSERYYGAAERNFTLEHAVDESKAQAKYNNGVLELVLPKKTSSVAGKRLVID